MYPAVFVDDTVFGIVTHARGPHVVPASVYVGGPRSVVIAHDNLQPTELGAAEFGADDFQRPPHAVLIDRA